MSGSVEDGYVREAPEEGERLEDGVRQDSVTRDPRLKAKRLPHLRTDTNSFHHSLTKVLTNTGNLAFTVLTQAGARTKLPAKTPPRS